MEASLLDQRSAFVAISVKSCDLPDSHSDAQVDVVLNGIQVRWPFNTRVVLTLALDLFERDFLQTATLSQFLVPTTAVVLHKTIC